MEDTIYKIARPLVFALTDGDTAHELMAKYGSFVTKHGLIRTNGKDLKDIEISNAAGFNKDAEIPIKYLEHMGFTRAVIGTVTNEPWKGNDDKFITRFPKSESIVNYLGLPGLGSEEISERLKDQGLTLPITLNISPTPNKRDTFDKIDDIEATLHDFKKIEEIDRIELNISCPNTADKHNLSDTLMMIDNVERFARYDQAIYLKLSPDINHGYLKELMGELNEFDKLRGLTLTNSSGIHDHMFIKKSPGKGGASGRAVYDRSMKIQYWTENMMKGMKRKYDIIACGGIDSLKKLKERTTPNTKGYQVFTGLIYKGPGLIKQLRS